MTRDLLAAVCLVLVLEGLLLFGAPRLWKAMVQQLGATSDRDLRIYGGVMVGLGLICLQLVR